MQKNNKKIILIILVSAIILFGFFFFKSGEISTPIAELSLSYENISPGTTTVYDFMDKLRREGKLDFTERNYIGMGKFVVSINGVKGNGSKNWIYYVNNKKMDIGISNYKITKGDVVSWKYEDSF